MTGAAIPEGADMVFMVEDSSVSIFRTNQVSGLSSSVNLSSKR